MAAYESHTVTTNTNSVSLAATKPSGLAVGDMMVCILIASEFSDITIVNASTPTGWYAAGEADSGGGGDSIIAVFAKVADSSDVAASTFTFSFTSTMDKIVAQLFRVSATGSFTDASTQVSAVVATDSSTGGENNITASSLTPIRTSPLMIMAAGLASDTNVAFSGYGLANNNPTWTETEDALFDPSGIGLNYSSAYATYSASTATGNFDIDVSLNGNYVLGLVSINEDVSVEITPTTLALTPTINTPTLSAGVSFTPTTLVSAPTINPPTVSGKTKTQWTNEAQESTTWINEADSV